MSEEEKKPQSITITIEEEGKINVNIQGIDPITGIFVLQTAMNMVQQRIQNQSRLILQPGMTGGRRVN